MSVYVLWLPRKTFKKPELYVLSRGLIFFPWVEFHVPHMAHIVHIIPSIKDKLLWYI